MLALHRVGILGLPASGKTTLFEILMQGAGVGAGASGQDTMGVVTVPDERVDRLSGLFQPRKTTYTQIQFVDSAAAGQRGRARGTDLFAGVRHCAALVAVVRDFENPAVPIEGGVDPERDRRAIEDELILNDLAIVETRLERIEKERKVGKGHDAQEHSVLERVRALLEAGTPLRAESFDAAEERTLRGFQMLSRKPLLVVLNQDDASERAALEVGAGALGVRVRAQIEREIVALPPADRAAYRAELGVEEDALALVIRKCYELLGLISFFTVGPDEVRAWTLRRGAHAVDAAGEIHSDLARGFIRAQVVDWRELIEHGGLAGARTRGTLRLEGRDYVVNDGDTLEIRFSA